MKNEHEIIGKAVDDILHGKSGDFFNRDMLAQHLMHEFIRVAATDMPVEEKRLYESAMKMVVKPVK